MIRKIFIPAVILLLSSGGTDSFAASGEWTATLSVSTPNATVPGGTVSNILSMGMREETTDGYDNATDTVSFLEVDDPIQAYFPHGAVTQDNDGDGVLDGFDCPSPEAGYNAYQCSLWRDFRSLSGEKSWTFVVISPLNGATLSLDLQINGNPSVELTLTDLSASPPEPPIRLDQASHYAYTNILPSGQKYNLRKFEVRAQATGLFITPSALPSGTANAPYGAILHLVGGSGMWSLETGELPPGLMLNSSGLIEGNPLREGDYPFTVRVEDALTGQSIRQEYLLTIRPPLTLSPLELPAGGVRGAYSYTFGSDGGLSPYTWELSSGFFPEGLSLDRQSGILSGTLQVPGVFDFAIQVKDSAGAQAVQSYRVTVTEPADTASPSPISDLAALYGTASTTVLSWSAPDDDSLTGTAAVYDLRYSPDCLNSGDPAWWDAAIQAAGEPRPQAGAFHTYSLSGLETGKSYCAAVQSRDASGHLSPLSNIVYFPDGVSPGPSNSTGLVTRQVVLNQGYNLISVPLVPLPNDLSAFEDDMGSPAALYRWYSAYPGLTPPQWYREETVQPGHGFFLFVPEAETTLDLTGLEIEDPEVVIPLQPGWNLIGNPYGAELSLNDVKVREIRESGEKVTKTFEEAAGAEWVGNALYPFTGSAYAFVAVNDDPAPRLKPWVGFWLYSNETGKYEIVFPKP